MALGRRKMNAEDKAVLEKLLDMFDSLYDRESSVAEVHALILASAEMLPRSVFTQLMHSAAADLLAIIRSDADDLVKNRAALVVVQQLREEIANVV